MTEAIQPTQPIEVFFSYAHEDEELRDQLEKHLSTLKKNGFIAGWHDRKIGAGEEWEGQIDKHINSAKIILLLVSADFLASDYCYDVEMRRAIERHEAGEARIIPIILRDVDWVGVPFSSFKMLPSDAKPLTTWENRDRAFADVARGIRKAVEDIIKERQQDASLNKTAPEANARSSTGRASEPKTEILEASQDHTSGASIKFARNLLDAIEASKTRCRQAGLRYLTPHLLLALLQIPDGFARRCFDEVVAGLAGKVVRSLQVYVEQELPRLAKGVSEEGAEGYRWRDFSWSELESIRVGADIASHERSPLVTTRHVLLGFLRSDSITAGDLRMKLGEQKFALLVDTVINTPDEQKPRIPTLKNGSIFKTPPE